MSKPQTLRRKLFLARKAAEAVEKKGEAENFSYARYEDVLAEASKQLEKRGILIVPRMVDSSLHFGKGGTIAKAVLEYEVIDTEGNESLTIPWAGTGHDFPGDKALSKATTGGTKDFLAKLLGIAFGPDPEAPAGSPQTSSVGSGTLIGNNGGLLDLGGIAWKLKAAGADSSPEAVDKLLKDCGIGGGVGEDDTGFVPVSTEQAESVHFEIKRIQQDAAAVVPDVAPSREKPLPESGLPAPDWEGLAEDGAAHV